MIRHLYLVLCNLILCCLYASAQDVKTQSEQIINFHSDITIDSSGLVKVSEHIKVYAAGEQIVHGLMRTIPLYRKDILGTRKKVDFEIVSVEQNGEPEDYKTEDSEDDRKIYIGQSDITLANGIYDYTITYQSRGHIGFFKGYDELYWNVTGNDWNFKIEKASATITVPYGAKAGNISCYTGVSGSTDKACNGHVNANGSVTFSTTGQLNPGEGFTIAVSFTAGLVKRPNQMQLLYQDYFNVIAGLIMILLFAGVYYFLWHKFGRDPQMPLTVPSYHIPMNWSPALLRYYDKKGYDNKTAAVALINMAVKKMLKITSPEGDLTAYQFDKISEDPTKLPDEERVFFDTLLEDKKSIKTTEKYAATFVKAREKFESSVKAQLNLKDYYAKNTRTAIWTGLLALIALVIYLVATGNGKPLIILFLLPFIIIGVSIFFAGFRKLKTAVGGGALLMIIGLIAGGMPTIVGVILIGSISPVTIVVMLIMVIMYIVFVKTITAFTTEGIRIQNEIEGFKLYLSTAEENRLNLLNPPEHTPQLFEKFLPYAIALDLENAWGEKFSQILEQTDYVPDWYSGDGDYRRFTSSVPQKFYNAVGVNPAPSNSGSSSGSSGSSSWSSGSSGGGSSGGGGGGGGGGW